MYDGWCVFGITMSNVAKLHFFKYKKNAKNSKTLIIITGYATLQFARDLFVNKNKPELKKFKFLKS